MRRESERTGEEELPPTPLRRELQRWEGRRWESRFRLLGWPLVSIAFSDPDRDFAGYGKGEKARQRTARGWIAIGDRAVGLVALGNLACGGIAIGAVACGAVSLGGVAVGGLSLGGVTLAVLSIGGFSLGWGALGGMALGWYAFGGAAVAWKAASGGFALARDFAVGGEAIAREANSPAARDYIESSGFFDLGQGYLAAVQNPWVLLGFHAFLLGAIGAMLAIGFRRRPTE